jgi:hypothetical protein
MPSKSKSKISRTGFGYYHDLDPYKVFPTKALATADRSKLYKQADSASRSPRTATFYTILQDKRKNDPTKFGSVPQGPHTFPHHGIHRGIVEARAQGKLDLFAPLIPSPGQYDARVDNEIPKGHLKRRRAEVAQGIFKKRHLRFSQLQALGNKRDEQQNIRFAHAINKLIQMDPFGVYAFKGKGASKKSLSHKGEKSTLPLANQIDLPTNHGINDAKGVQTRNTSLLTTLAKVNVK